MTLGILGMRGYIGLRLAQLAEADGHRVIPFSRRPAAGYREVSPGRLLDLSGLDAVVNLAGEPILGLWTAKKKKKSCEAASKPREASSRPFPAAGHAF